LKTRYEYELLVSRALEGCESTTAISILIALTIDMLQALGHDRREAVRSLIALARARSHSWAGERGSPTAHCMVCRLPRTGEAELVACEGTCICKNCGHHIDAHQPPGFWCNAGPTNTSGVSSCCDCRHFDRGKAIWDDARGWILASLANARHLRALKEAIR
jgi:hypothetical protein